jgi:transcriptional regulator with XRE-family HTH domain
MNFGDNLQKLRKQHNMSQEQLAERLNVTRQAVSRWESGDSFPEMDKALMLRELFDVSLDDLMENSALPNTQTDRAAYDAFMNKFARAISIGVGLLIIGLAFLIATPLNSRSAIPLMAASLVSIPLFVYFGIQRSSIIKSINPKIAYTEKEIAANNSAFATKITLGVLLLVTGFIAFLLFNEHAVDGNWSAVARLDFDNQSGGNWPLLLWFAATAIGVPILVHAGIIRSKYTKSRAAERPETVREQDEKMGKVCGVIMLSATAVFLVIGLAFDIWHPTWIVFPIGGIACAIVGTIWSPPVS